MSVTSTYFTTLEQMDAYGFDSYEDAFLSYESKFDRVLDIVTQDDCWIDVNRVRDNEVAITIVAECADDMPALMRAAAAAIPLP